MSEKLLHIITIIILTSFNNFVSIAQSQLPFSQYMNNELRINPAYAGRINALSFAIAARNQWSGISEAPTLYTFTAHTPIIKKTAVGITYALTNQGLLNENSISGQFSYTIELPANKTLSLGVNAGTRLQKYNFHLINDIKDDGDPIIGNTTTNIGVIAGAGVYYTSKNIEIGLSAPELISPDVGNKIQLPNVLYLYSKYKHSLDYNWLLIPTVFLQQNFIHKQVSYNINLGVAYNQALYFSLGTKSFDELMTMCRLRLADMLALGYSIDIPLSSENNKINALSHEIMINYVLAIKNYHSSWNRAHL